MLEEIAKRLKEARVNARMTGKDAAAKLKIGASTLSQYENAIHEPTFEMAIEMAKLYGADLNWIMTGKVFEKKIESRDDETLLESFHNLDEYTRGKIMGIIETSVKK
jgi:transcriptional regulator with XRE-family HTH domain